MKNRKVLILGLGISGKSAAKALAKKQLRVFVYDDNIKEIPNEIKNFNIQIILNSSDVLSQEFDFVMKSPGINPENPMVKSLKEKGVEILSDIELGYRFKNDVKIIAITGTNGKTTTTTLINDILNNSNIKSEVVGNIGIGAVEKLVNSDNEYLVLECSSFQLDDIKEFKPDIALITNISTDHLDYHKNIKNYKMAKLNILKNMDSDDFVVLNYDDDNLKNITGEFNKVFISGKDKIENGFYFNDGFIFEIENNNIIASLDTSKVIIKGLHNYYNIMCALSVSKILNLDRDMVYKAISDFKGVKHRLQFVDEIQGVSYYNDSKGTNTDSTMKAISSFDEPIVIILGGYNKNEDFKKLLEFGKDKIKSIIAFGETKEYILDLSDKLGYKSTFKVNTLREAIKLSKDLTEFGDVLLFSPASASWDMYKNFEERGDDFISLVRNIDAL